MERFNEGHIQILRTFLVEDCDIEERERDEFNEQREIVSLES